MHLYWTSEYWRAARPNGVCFDLQFQIGFSEHFWQPAQWLQRYRIPKSAKTYELPALCITVADHVANVAIDYPPLNHSDSTRLPSLRRFVAQVRDGADVRVIVFDSADPEILIAHGDTRFIAGPEVMAAAGRQPWRRIPMRSSRRPRPHAGRPWRAPRPPAGHHREADRPRPRWRQRVPHGARHAPRHHRQAGQAQSEVLMDIMTGGGGTQYRTVLVGCSRARRGAPHFARRPHTVDGPSQPGPDAFALVVR